MSHKHFVVVRLGIHSPTATVGPSGTFVLSCSCGTRSQMYYKIRPCIFSAISEYLTINHRKADAMVNGRLKSKTKSNAPNTALKREATGLTPPTVLDNSNLSEAALRKLPRAELQNLAKVGVARCRGMIRALMTRRSTK